MDTLDREILSCLEQNSREKASVISRKINLSVSAVLERIRKMEQQGVILGYTVHTDKRALGLGMQAIMEVGLDHASFYDDFIEMVGRVPEIADCYYLNGDFDFLLKLYARDPEDLEKIHKSIKDFKGNVLIDTNTDLMGMRQMHLEPGRDYVIRFHARLPLREGNYILNF